MNGLERYLGMLKGRPIDFTPRAPIVMQYAAEHIGSHYGAFASDYNVLVAANLRCAQDFGFDQLSAISDPYRETHGFGGRITYPLDSVPQCTHPLDKTTDLSVLTHPDPLRSERMADRIGAISEYKKLAGGTYSIMGWVEGPAAEAADLRGVQNFLLDTIEAPDFLCDLMDLCVDAGIEFARAQIDAGADTIGIGDAVVSQLSPDFYDSMIRPREKRLVEAVHAAGAYVRLHICGNITRLLPSIAGLDIDVLDIDHMVDLKEARSRLGTRTILAGNIDPVSGVLRGDPTTIRRHMEDACRAAAGRYIASAGCEIPSGTPVENLKALCEPIPPYLL